MSLEEALKANTAALYALADAMKSAQATAAAPVATVATAAPLKATPRAVAPTPAPAPAAEEKPKTSMFKGTKAPTPAPTKAPAPAAEDGYLPVKAKILELGAIPGVGRAAVTEILGSFGVTRGPDLQPEQYSEALDQLTLKIEELTSQA